MGWFSKKPKAKAALDATAAIAANKDTKKAKDAVAELEAGMNKSVQSMAANDTGSPSSDGANPLVDHLSRVVSGTTNPVDATSTAGAGPLPLKKSKDKKKKKKSADMDEDAIDQNSQKHRKHHHHTHHHEHHVHGHKNETESERTSPRPDDDKSKPTDVTNKNTTARPMLTPISEERKLETSNSAPEEEKVPITPEFSPNDEPDSNTTIMLDFGKKDSFGVKFVATNSKLKRNGTKGSVSPRGSRPQSTSPSSKGKGSSASPASSTPPAVQKAPTKKSPKTTTSRNTSPRGSVTPRSNASPKSSSGDLSDRGRDREAKNVGVGPKSLKKGKDVGGSTPTSSRKLKKSREVTAPEKLRKKKKEPKPETKTMNTSSSTKLLLDTTTAGEYESAHYASEATASPMNSLAKLPKLRKDNNVQSYASLDTDFGGRRKKDNLVSPTPSFNEEAVGSVNPYIGDDYNPYKGENYFTVKDVESGVVVSEESVSQQKKRFNAQDTIVNPYAKDFDPEKMANVPISNESADLTPRSADALVAQHLVYGHLHPNESVADEKTNGQDKTFADELERYMQEHEDEAGSDKKHIVVEERTHIVFEERTHILVDPSDEMANALSEHSGGSSPRGTIDKNSLKSSGKGSCKEELLKNGRNVNTIKKGGRTLTKGNAKGFGKRANSPGRAKKKKDDRSLQQQKNELLGDLVLNQGAAVVQEEGTVRNYTDSPRVFEYGVGGENGSLEIPAKETGHVEQKEEGRVNLVVDTETKLYSRPVTPKLASVSDFSPCSNDLKDVLSPNTIEQSSTVGPRTPTKEHEELRDAAMYAAHEQHDSAAREIQVAWRKRQSYKSDDGEMTTLALSNDEVAKVGTEKNDLTVFQSGKMVVGGTVSPIAEENTVSEPGSSICANAAGTVHASKKVTVKRQGKNQLVISTKGKSRGRSPVETDNSGKSTPVTVSAGKGRSRSPNKASVTINNGENSGVTIIIQEQHSSSNKSLDTKGKGKDNENGNSNNVTIFKDDTPRNKKATTGTDSQNSSHAIKDKAARPNKNAQGVSSTKPTSPRRKRSASPPTHNESSEQDSNMSSSGLAGLKVSTLNRCNIVNPGAVSRNAKRDLQKRLQKTADENQFLNLESKLKAEDNNETGQSDSNRYATKVPSKKATKPGLAARSHYYGPAKPSTDSRVRSESAGRKGSMVERAGRMIQKPRSPTRDQERSSDGENGRSNGGFLNKSRIVRVPSKTRVGKSNVPALGSGASPPSLSVPTLGNAAESVTGSKSRENSASSVNSRSLLLGNSPQDAGKAVNRQISELSTDEKEDEKATAGSSPTARENHPLPDANENGQGRVAPNPFFISADELSILTTVAKQEREDFFRAKMTEFQVKEEFWVDRSVQVMLERNAVQRARLGESCFFVHWYGERIPNLDEQVNNYGQPLPSGSVKNGKPLSPLSSGENTSGSSKKRLCLNTTHSGSKNTTLNRRVSPSGSKGTLLKHSKHGNASSRTSSVEYKSGDVQLQLRKNSSVPIPLDTKTGKLLRQQGLTAENNLGRERPPKCNFDECRNSPQHWLKKVALKMKSLGYVIEEYNVFYESCGLLSFVCSWG